MAQDVSHRDIFLYCCFKFLTHPALKNSVLYFFKYLPKVDCTPYLYRLNSITYVSSVQLYTPPTMGMRCITVSDYERYIIITKLLVSKI
jgi:hypothetical protein